MELSSGCLRILQCQNSFSVLLGTRCPHRRRFRANKTVIELVHLRKEYDNVLAVDDLELTIPQGEIYGLIGPNGAGKTTTIRMTCGLLAPTLGRALVAGVDVAREPEKAQQNIGYLSDFFAVYE